MVSGLVVDAPRREQFAIWETWFRISAVGFRVSGSRVSGSGFVNRARAVTVESEGFEIRDSGFGFGIRVEIRVDSGRRFGKKFG